jgi:hypothetical protein
MEFDNLPQRLDWPAITQGDTFRAMVFACTDSDTILARVRCKVKSPTGALLLSLDSDDTGITLDSTTAGAWQFTIGPILPATTEGMPAGCNQFDIEITDSNGIRDTDFSGCWTIYPQVTDA